MINKLKNKFNTTIIEQMESLEKTHKKVSGKNLTLSDLESLGVELTFQSQLMNELNAFNIPHPEYLRKFQQHWDFLLIQDMSNWNKILFHGFDMTNVKHFRMLVNEFLENPKNKTNIVNLAKISGIVQVFAGHWQALERNGYVFPGFSSELFLKIWIPEHRKIYEKIYEFSDKEFQENHVKELFECLSYAVTHFLLNICDYNIFGIYKENYLPELSYLKKAIRISQLVENYDINGEIIDCILSMEKPDNYLLEQIDKNHEFLLENQFKSGAWAQTSDGSPCVHAIHTAISSLLDHSHLIIGSKKFGQHASYKKFKKVTKESGLFLSLPEKFGKRMVEHEHLIRGHVIEKLKEQGLDHLIDLAKNT